MTLPSKGCPQIGSNRNVNAVITTLSHDPPNPPVAPFRPSNPAYTAEELTYQIDTTKAKLLITHSLSLQIALDAAKDSGLPSTSIIVIDTPPNVSYPTLDILVREGLSKPPTFVERKLNPGEAKTKLALLSFSSGTTGRPKAVAIPHISLIANVIQMAVHCKVNAPTEQQRYRPGDVIYAGKVSFVIVEGSMLIKTQCYLSTVSIQL